MTYLRYFIFVESKDANFCEILETIQWSNLVFWATNLNKVQQISQGLKTLYIIFIKTDVFQVTQIFYSC